ncbi:hypothetical protein ACR03S_10210 [Limimaricola variabilis]
MTGTALSTNATMNSSVASPREKSTEDLIRATRGPTDAPEVTEAKIQRRARTTLGFHYQPERSDAEMARTLERFARALMDLPLWAVFAGFDDADRTIARRPSPAEVRMLAQRRLQPITDELARRRKDAEEREAERRAREAQRCSREEAERICASRGFTPRRFGAVAVRPMATSREELEVAAAAPPKPHWSETVAPDSADMQALRDARAANPLMRAGMAGQGDAA